MADIEDKETDDVFASAEVFETEDAFLDDELAEYFEREDAFLDDALFALHGYLAASGSEYRYPCDDSSCQNSDAKDTALLSFAVLLASKLLDLATLFANGACKRGGAVCRGLRYFLSRGSSASKDRTRRLKG